MIEHLAVFLGSRDGRDSAHVDLARHVGRQLAERNIELVYGAGGGGLMGHLSQAVLEHGGRVYGVIPRFMVDREWGRPHQTLAVHGKPSGLLNPDGFWDPLLAMLDHIVDAGFTDRRTVGDLVVASDLDGVLAGLELAS